MMFPKLGLSVCIVNWNTCDLLRACLRSIYAYPPQVSYEVLVVDNASRDGSAEMVRREFPQVRLFANAENLGYAEGNNQCLRAARGEYLLLLNPDTEIVPHLCSPSSQISDDQPPVASGHPSAAFNHPFEVLVHFLEEHPAAAAVGGRLVGPKGEVQATCRSFPTPGALLWEFVGLSRLSPHSRLFGAYRMTYFAHDRVREVDQPMGSCLLLRRAALREVGLFDPQFRIFFNDVDLCYRLKQAGWRLYFTPKATLLHHGAASTKQVRLALVRESGRALLQFYRKHYRSRYHPAVYALATAAIRVAYTLRYALLWTRAGRERTFPAGPAPAEG
ncbi:MAG TPA: glycosyltransferase [Armatimonadetes bacterium]|nr:glycosyltransferase [Armatimonadota bacterium]